jgi:hypothetical protein
MGRWSQWRRPCGTISICSLGVSSRSSSSISSSGSSNSVTLLDSHTLEICVHNEILFHGVQPRRSAPLCRLLHLKTTQRALKQSTLVPPPWCRRGLSYRPLSTTALSAIATAQQAQPTQQQQQQQPAFPSFKVARICYKEGTVETMNLDTSELMKATSLYARDLFFTLNLTSRHERYRPDQQPPDPYHPHSTMKSSLSSTSSSALIVPRRTVSVIQSRVPTSTILLSFGKLQAVTNLTHIYLLNAHNPAVQAFAQYLSAIFTTSPSSSSSLESSTDDTSGITNPTSGTNKEPNELIFLECCLRDTVDSYFRRLRLFEPIGTS